MGEPNNTGDVTVFDKIGGEAAVRSMVDNFYKRVVADPSLAPYFSHVPLDTLRNMQFEFFFGGAGRSGSIHRTANCPHASIAADHAGRLPALRAAFI